jgi:hypothetical protein
MEVDFKDPNELAKVFIIKNRGFLRQKNQYPAGYIGTPIWNIDLPLFAQNNSWDIFNYPSNFRPLKSNKTVVAGTKELTFI